MPDTVGKRRRDGFHDPSGLRSSGPAMPMRGWNSAKARRTASAPGSASVSGLQTTTNSPLVSAIPRFAFAAKPTGSSFRISLAPSGTGSSSAEVRDDHELVDLRLQRGEAALQLRDRLVDDDDARDAHSRLR